MAVILMSVWARVVAITATYRTRFDVLRAPLMPAVMILGGFVDVWYYEPWYSVYIGLYSMVVGALLFPLLWPFDPLRCLVYPFQVYWLAALILALLTFPLWFAPPTCLAALCLCIASAFYVAGFIKGERGQSFEQLSKGEMAPVSRERAE